MTMVAPLGAFRRSVEAKEALDGLLRRAENGGPAAKAVSGCDAAGGNALGDGGDAPIAYVDLAGALGSFAMPDNVVFGRPGPLRGRNPQNRHR